MGICPWEKVMTAYSELEAQIGCFDNCRKIHEKWISTYPESGKAWTEYAKFESSLNEIEWAREIFKAAISMDLDSPEEVWKSFISFEIENSEVQNAWNLYLDLIEKTQHFKAYLNYAQFELRHSGIEAAREVYWKAESVFRTKEKDARVLIFNAWLWFEEESGQEETLQSLLELKPKKVRKRRKIKIIENGEEVDAGWEEFYDWQFPEEKQAPKRMKILDIAQKWKKDV